LRPKKPPVNSGHPVINQIKERARYLNLSMGDVDAMAGTKKYFYTAQWVSAGRPNLKAVGKAILALDGELALAPNRGWGINQLSSKCRDDVRAGIIRSPQSKQETRQRPGALGHVAGITNNRPICRIGKGGTVRPG
jgi:hypothetical protein